MRRDRLELLEPIELADRGRGGGSPNGPPPRGAILSLFAKRQVLTKPETGDG